MFKEHAKIKETVKGQSRLFELRDEMGDEACNMFSLVVGRQAKVLWQELGHADLLLRKPSGS